MNTTPKPTHSPNIILIHASLMPYFAKKKKGQIILLPHAIPTVEKVESLKQKRPVTVDRVIFVNDIFLDNYDRPETYRLSMGGYGSGKSYAKALEYLLLALRPDFFRALYVRKNLNDVRDSQYKLFCDIIKAYDLGDYFDIHDGRMDITCRTTGNELLAAGLSEVSKLKGVNDVTHVWYEEPINKGRKGKKRRADITRDDFETLNIRVRTEKAELHIDLTFNPINKSTWIYEDFVHPKKKKYTETVTATGTLSKKWHTTDTLGEAHILQTTYLDNYFTSDKTKKDMERLEGEEAVVGRLGQWANEATGYEWLYKFRRDVHVGKVVYVKDLTTHLAYDFNMLPYQTMLAIQTLRYFNKKKAREVLQIRVYKEYCFTPPLNSPKACCEAWIDAYPKRYGSQACSIYGDCSGKWGVDDYIAIEEYLKDYIASDGNQVGTHNPNRHTIREIINDILRGEYDIEILIDEENCPTFIDDCENLQTDVKGFDPEKDDGIETRGHTYSAFAYFIAQFFEYLLADR